MKKISLKTFRKSFNIKGKEDGDFVMLQKPTLGSEFGKDEALFSGCYGKDLACELHGGGDDARGPKTRSKSESLMGTLKRRLSTKQKTKGKGGPSSGDDVDTFSSSSVPISFNEVKAQRPLRSSSLHSHHYSPAPWPLRPPDPEEACIKMEVRVKATVHSPSPSPSSSSSLSSLNGVQKDFHAIPIEGFFQHRSQNLKNSESRTSISDRSNAEEHVPVVIGLAPQDYIHYTMPLDEGMYPDSSDSSPMEVTEQADADSTSNAEAGNEDILSSDIFMSDQSVGGLLLGSNPGIAVFQNSRDGAFPFSPFSAAEIPRTCPPLSAADPHVAEQVRRHLTFDPNSAPGVSRVYDSVQSSGVTTVVTSLTEELKKLAKQGWYWGPITRWEAEEKLLDLPDGSFLVRDSSDDRYLLSLSFRSQGKTLHTRIEHSNGRFSFYEQPDVEGHASIVDLIELSIKDSESGAFCYSRSRLPGSATYPVRLTGPVSRFMQVRSLQYLCRFVIRQYTRIDLIQKLPLPNKMKDYLQEKHY